MCEKKDEKKGGNATLVTSSRTPETTLLSSSDFVCRKWRRCPPRLPRPSESSAFTDIVVVLVRCSVAGAGNEAVRGSWGEHSDE